MPPVRLTETQIQQVTKWVAAYISEQEKLFAKKATPISSDHKAALLPFFPANILEEVRIVRGRAREPSFYGQLRALGITNPPPFSEMAGITFQRVVVHAEPLTHALLFHELVHAVQYSHLGLSGFAERYVRGFLHGGCYEEIPLEKQAYELEAKFASAPARAFSVDEDVKRRVRLRQI